MTGDRVEVDPATVLGALDQLRQASRQYSAAGWRMSTSLPLMPLAFMAHAQMVLDVIAGQLQTLAVALEVDAAVEGWRISRLTEAGAGDVAEALRRLVTDLGAEGRQAWDDLSRESGMEAMVDPIGGNVHLLLGALDNISQLFQIAVTFSHLGPGYAEIDPQEAARARQETIAMAINLTELFPEAAILDPEGHRLATERTAAKIVDWNDLQRGDFPRWTGHIGSGLALAWMARGLRAASSADAQATETPAGGLAGALNTAYDGLSQANHLPADTGPRRPRRAVSALDEIEHRAAGFLKQLPPRRVVLP